MLTDQKMSAKIHNRCAIEKASTKNGKYEKTA